MKQYWWLVLGYPRQILNPFFRKMGNIIFCVFVLFHLILDVATQFSEKIRILPRASGEKFGQWGTHFQLLFCCRLAINRNNAQKGWYVCNMFPAGENELPLSEKCFFVNYVHFYKIRKYRVQGYCDIVLSFLQKEPLFPGGGVHREMCVTFLQIFVENRLVMLGSSCQKIPEKKCHLFRKIATFFKKFDFHFSEKLSNSVKSPKNDHVPN